jgi:hypothetical protein
MVDYIIIGASIFIFAVYLITFIILISIKRRIDIRLGTSVIYMMIALLLLIARRLQQIFLESSILYPITYSSEIITVGFAIFFFLSIFSFYRNIRKAGGSRSIGTSLKDYKRSIGGKIIR